MSVQRVKKGTLHTDCELSSATVSSDSIFPMSCQRPQPLCTQEVCVSCFYNHVMLVTLTWMLTNPWGLLSPWGQKLWSPQLETFILCFILVPLLVFRLLLGARESIMSMPTGKEEQSCVCVRVCDPGLSSFWCIPITVALSHLPDRLQATFTEERGSWGNKMYFRLLMPPVFPIWAQ